MAVCNHVITLNAYSPNALKFICESPIVFYLTGSRFFGNAKKNSDWDFFTESTDETKESLHNNGFKRIRKDNYTGDPAIAEVWSNGEVQVQLIRDVHRKDCVQELIKRKVPDFPFVSKTFQQQVWILAYTLIREQQRGTTMYVLRLETQENLQKETPITQLPIHFRARSLKDLEDYCEHMGYEKRFDKNLLFNMYFWHPEKLQTLYVDFGS